LLKVAQNNPEYKDFLEYSINLSGEMLSAAFGQMGKGLVALICSPKIDPA
jgi:hypothetical protein